MNLSKLSSSQSPRGMARPDGFHSVPPPKESCQGIEAANKKSALHTFKLMIYMGQGKKKLNKVRYFFLFAPYMQFVTFYLGKDFTL